MPALVEQLPRAPSAQSRRSPRRYHDERFFLYLGRNMGFGVCLEGALKLKEISYIPTEAYAAGEMKHGPIALLDNGSPVVVVADDGPVFAKVVSNIEEVRARGADVIAVATEGNDEIEELSRDVLLGAAAATPLAPILAVVPLQLLAYHIACMQGPQRRPAAQPRQDRDGRVRRARDAAGRPAACSTSAVGIDALEVARMRAPARAPAARPRAPVHEQERAYCAGFADPYPRYAARSPPRRRSARRWESVSSASAGARSRCCRAASRGRAARPVAEIADASA